MNGIGYILKEYDDELVPFSEAQPSPDGACRRCKRADGSRRRFFCATARHSRSVARQRARASARNRRPTSIPLGLRTLEGRHAAARQW